MTHPHDTRISDLEQERTSLLLRCREVDGELSTLRRQRAIDLLTPCEVLFEYLVTADPDRLLAFLRDPELSPGLKTFAAEHAGKLPKDDAKTPLVELLKDPSPVVREGAMLGLSECGSMLDADVREHLLKLKLFDPSPTIRSLASDYFDEEGRE